MKVWRKNVEIISLLCGSKPTSSLCHCPHLQTTGFAWRLTSGDAVLVPVIKIQIFNLQILFLGYRGQYAWTRKDETISIIYLLRDYKILGGKRRYFTKKFRVALIEHKYMV